LLTRIVAAVCCIVAVSKNAQHFAINAQVTAVAGGIFVKSESDEDSSPPGSSPLPDARSQISTERENRKEQS
jgi:hypothetical protein